MATLLRKEDFTEGQGCSLVIAIDFGTTFSGYAFSLKPKEKNIFMYTKWGECVSIPSTFKAPTCVLTSIDGQFEAFGYEAQQRYSNLTHEEAHDHCYFDKFKMHLHTKTLSRATYITAISGHLKPALEIFAMVLQYLKHHALYQFEQQCGSLPKPDHIQWVITVPAIWSDASKQFMREAAHKAGIIDDLNSHQLLIALEPEAASVYCTDSYTEMSTYSDVGSDIGLPTETKYLVLDCGGGTVDVTAHKVNSKGKITEVAYATGGNHGGILVDKNIVGLLQDIFSKSVIDHFKLESPGEWLNMLIHIERLKHTVDPKDKKEKTLSMPFQLSESFEEVTGERFRTAIKEKDKSKGISMSGGLLRLPYSVIEETITPVTDKILCHVERLFQHHLLSEIRHIIVVGGFGQCPILLHELKAKFGPEYTFIVPAEANGCVLKGAVLFGHNQGIIAARKAKRTIGCNYNPPFDPAKHDPERIIMVNEAKHAENAFFPFITRGKSMKAGSECSTRFSVTTDTAEKIKISLFETAKTSPVYVEEEGVSKLGSIEIQLPTSREIREIELTVKYGGTEIKVEARDPSPDGDFAIATIDFLKC